ncbi:unnamed protein product [Adineta steineri]|uniref:Chaperone DnaJ C-terminal domain-containing protein n=1 Tax=Adineta steineri TaxID=433720 RepID=A0A819VEP1_9BILA|nr:unnamed protein product [Adineta steineri]CAF4107714.1 unnamed protein product [Adineta steineri]
MAIYVYPAAAAGSFIIRAFAETDIDGNTEKYLAKDITIDEATRIISENINYYVTIVTIKAVCDITVTSLVGRKLYSMFKSLWEILKPLLTAGLKSFINGIKHAGKCIQESLKELIVKGTFFHTIGDKIRSNLSLSGVLNTLDHIHKLFVCVKNGLCHTIQFELTKYYIEIMGLIRALCDKNNVNFLKYVAKADIELNSNGDQMDGRHKEEPFEHTYEISLEELLRGTERQLPWTREIRKKVGDQDPINIPADLHITIRSKPHPLFKRQGNNLVYIQTISYADSRSGNPIKVPLLDRGTISVDPKEPIDIDTQLIVQGHGLPDPDQNGARGELLVRFDIKAPSKKI